MPTPTIRTAARRTTRPVAPPADFQVKRFSVAEYDRMIRTGAIAESDRVELLDGWIVEKMPHNAPHDSAVYRAQIRLLQLLGFDWVVRAQSSVSLRTSVPEPDVAVAPGPDSRYDGARPTPRDLVLVVEVSDSSLTRDRGTKLRLYARALVPVYWIVNIPERRVEVYTDPHGGRTPGYRAHTDYAPGDDIPVVVRGKVIGSLPAAELLP